MKIEGLKQSLPPQLCEVVAGYTFHQIHLGLSPSKVFRLESKDKPNLYLKTSPRQPAFSLLQEKMRLEWLAHRLPVPRVLLFAEDESADYLILSEISGLPASDDSLKTDIPRIIEQLANGLKMIHALPVENCPFDARTKTVIELARERLKKGLVDEGDFDAERQGKTAEDVFRELSEIKLPDEDLVFTHGDYCVPNIILEKGKLNGFVDLGNAGIADRYQDLALLSRSVGYNFGEEYQKYVFEFYGIEPDHEKIYFFQLLDEFF